MAMTDLPILSMLRTRMQWHQERQRVLAENVANSDTPGFRPSDIKDLDFRNVTPQGVSLSQSNVMHFASIGGGDGRFQVERNSKNDVRPAGNAVNLEDEMMKIAQNQMDHQAATMLYTRSLNLLKTALGKR